MHSGLVLELTVRGAKVYTGFDGCTSDFALGPTFKATARMVTPNNWLVGAVVASQTRRKFIWQGTSRKADALLLLV